MGRKVSPLQLDEEQRQTLESAYRRTDSRKYARRCRIILRKADVDQPSNETIARELNMQEVTVAKWISRYRQAGLAGLTSRPIPGRPRLLNEEQDAQLVCEQVKRNRQRLELARLEIEKQKGQRMSSATLRRFLKTLGGDSEDCV